MTNANVSKMTDMLAFQKNASVSKADRDEGDSLDFMAVLGSLALSGQTQQYKNEGRNANLVDQKDFQIGYDKLKAADGRIPEASNRMDPTQMQAAQDAVKEFAEDVQKQVEDLFGVSKEELEQAMEEMGITYMDLLNPTNLANLMMRLTGAEDSLALLMNPAYQELLQNVELLGEGFFQSLGVDPNEAQALMEQLAQQADSQEEAPQANGAQDASQMGAVGDSSEGMSDQAADGMVVIQASEGEKSLAGAKDSAATMEDAQKIAQADSPEDAQDAISTVKEADGDAGNLQGQGENSQEASQENTQEEPSIFQRMGRQEQGKARVSNEPVAQNAQAVKVGETPIPASAAIPQTVGINVADIIRQVSEFTRIMYQGNVTSMEMQLNPENLGKVFVQVTAKNGVITAHLAAQNEAVKEALESQVATLKENMNQQGLKVEAVEVTIASHEFERNLEENQQNQGQEEQREQASKSQGRRGIVRNQLDELSGLMSEEELLAAKIMRDHGNSVDFTA